jgi:hypothetical protein
MPYSEAVKSRPNGACYCDMDDEACYQAGHWSPLPWRLNPQDELSRAKRTLDLHGYYAVKKDRVKTLKVGASVSELHLEMSTNRKGYEESIKVQMFKSLGIDLMSVVPVTDEPDLGPAVDRRVYRASVDIILPRKD